jgi:serine/threonine-protein kinase
MEHLQGETLAERLTRGPLPVAQALELGAQIADALDAAHKHGIIHRDLKPGNVMLTKAGAKLLDFGLAKLAGHGAEPVAAQLASVATRSAPLTAEGTIVGTLQYMAPEQVEGKPADARTDLWALGALLYEMLTGKRAFEGTSAASLIGNIMNAEPPSLATLQPLTPPALDRVVKKCLGKQPDDRWDTAHDVADELRWIAQVSAVGTTTGVPLPGRRVPAAWLMAGLVAAAAAAGAAATWWLRPAQPLAPTAPVAHLSLDVRPADSLEVTDGTPGGSRTALAWTPDGQALVFVGVRAGVRQLYVRRLDASEARPLAGTEGAQEPAVSADGQWVAFFANGTIKKVPLGGGLVDQVRAGKPFAPTGLVWDDRGRLVSGGIVVGGGGGAGIEVLPPEGPPQVLTTASDAETGHLLPWPLPGGQAFLYTVRKRRWSWGDEEIVAQAFRGGTRKPVLTDGADARYLPTGHLVFMRQGKLFAVPFDPDRLEARGKPVPVLDEVAQALSAGNTVRVSGAGQFAVASTGTLAWVSSPVVPYPDRELVSVDRAGHVTALAAATRPFSAFMRLSPEGRRLAVTVRTLTESGLWIYDLERGNLTPVNREGESDYPVWSPDGQRLAFAWGNAGGASLAMQPADGSAAPTTLLTGILVPSTFSPDGRQIAAVTPHKTLNLDIMIVKLDQEKAAVQPLVATPRLERWPELSPDGRWLAYGSDASDRDEVYVQPFPGPGPVQRVSVDGGQSPAWHRNGRELFFLSPRDKAGKRWMMAAEFSAVADGSRVGRPRPLFPFDAGELLFLGDPLRAYDVSSDGLRFYATRQMARSSPPVVTHINLILNWFEELQAKVPVRR